MREADVDAAAVPRVESRFGIARVLSKHGVCSRSRASALVRAGRVSIAGRVVVDPEHPVGAADQHNITIDGQPLLRGERCCIAINKPRGLIVTASDEHSRNTVYECLREAALPWLAPVGRLDRASEGLLLLCNDPKWGARITDPASNIAKTYRVQVSRVPGVKDIAALRAGISDASDFLHAHSVELLRSGGKTAWLEIVLHGGRNRQIRRMLAARDLPVLRLIRVAIGPLALGDLAKGGWRALTSDEITDLAPRS